MPLVGANSTSTVISLHTRRVNVLQSCALRAQGRRGSLSFSACWHSGLWGALRNSSAPNRMVAYKAHSTLLSVEIYQSMSPSKSTSLDYVPSTLPPAIHRLSVASMLIASIAFFISISHLGKWSHCFTLAAWGPTFVYWGILAMRAGRGCAPENSNTAMRPTAVRSSSLNSQTAIYAPPSPLDKGTSNRPAYPSYVTHPLNLITSFLLAGAWSGGSWIAIATGAKYKRDGEDEATVLLPVAEGVLGYVVALTLWALFGLCLRARIYRGRWLLLPETQA